MTPQGQRYDGWIGSDVDAWNNVKGATVEGITRGKDGISAE
jgi:hypothetical protein